VYLLRLVFPTEGLLFVEEQVHVEGLEVISVEGLGLDEGLAMAKGLGQGNEGLLSIILDGQRNSPIVVFSHFSSEMTLYQKTNMKY
jgi:hypothetical protein